MARAAALHRPPSIRGGQSARAAPTLPPPPTRVLGPRPNPRPVAAAAGAGDAAARREPPSWARGQLRQPGAAGPGDPSRTPRLLLASARAGFAIGHACRTAPLPASHRQQLGRGPKRRLPLQPGHPGPVPAPRKVRREIPSARSRARSRRTPSTCPACFFSVHLLLLQLIGTFYLRKNGFSKLKYWLLLWKCSAAAAGEIFKTGRVS